MVIAVITENSKYKSLQNRRAYCHIDIYSTRLCLCPMVIIYNQSAFTAEINAFILKTQLKHTLFGQNLRRMCSHAYYFILTIFVSPALDVTNLFSHKLAYQVFFKMADDCRKFYDISEQLNAIDK